MSMIYVIFILASRERVKNQKITTQFDYFHYLRSYRNTSSRDMYVCIPMECFFPLVSIEPDSGVHTCAITAYYFYVFYLFCGMFICVKRKKITHGRSSDVLPTTHSHGHTRVNVLFFFSISKPIEKPPTVKLNV